jgi:hypothetical protein
MGLGVVVVRDCLRHKGEGRMTSLSFARGVGDGDGDDQMVDEYGVLT